MVDIGVDSVIHGGEYVSTCFVDVTGCVRMGEDGVGCRVWGNAHVGYGVWVFGG